VPAARADLPPERVDADAVVLRRIRSTDAGAVAAAVAGSLDHLRPWMPWATPDSADRRSQLARVAEADEMWESGISYIYSVLTADQGTLVGEIGLHRRGRDVSEAEERLKSAPQASRGHCIEIGYWIAGSQTRRGFGTSAAAAITDVALALPGVSRVEIHCDEANTASAAIPRKLGYRLDRVEERKPEAPGESGRLMIWVMDHAGPPDPEPEPSRGPAMLR
jgi:RimJ/RimL family protein N-acetyltransferase